MQFLSIAAIFLAAGVSVFADGPNTVVNTVHITEVVTLAGTAPHLQTEHQTIFEISTVLAPGYQHKSISMPPLKPFTKKRKIHSTKIHFHSVKPKHTNVAKAKIGARDVVDDQQNIVVEIVHETHVDVKTVHEAAPAHVETVKGTKVEEKTVTVGGADHARAHVTNAAFKELKKVKKHKKHHKAPKVVAAKEKRSWGAGWFA